MCFISRKRRNDNGKKSYIESNSKDILIKTCIDRVATHVAKLHPNHVVMKKGKKQPANNSQLQTLLALSPNPYMNAYSFLYNLATKAIANKNAFAYIKRDRQRNVISLWPMEYQSCEAREDDHGNLYIMFRYGGTHSTRTIPYTDLIHLRNMFQQGEIFADTDDNLSTHMAMLTKLEQSFDNVVENSGRIRGIAKIAGQAGTEAWKSKAKMLNENLKDPAQGGMVVTDGTMEFTPVDSEPKAADTAQLEFVRDTIYHYFGVSKPIAEGVYDETAWSAFFESVIEPFSIQMSQEFTRKLFTPAEISAGNEIVFDANRLTYASTDTNAAATYDGFDEETDDELRERLLFKVRQPATSGNINDYIEWGTSVEGVGHITVVPLWNGNGTVKLLVTDSNGQPASPDLLARVTEKVETMHPIGADVSVIAPSVLGLTIALTPTKGGGDADAIKKVLNKYFLSKQYTEKKVSYAKVGQLIIENSDTTQVEDYDNLTINGATANIGVDTDQIPSVVEVVLNA